MKLLELSVDNLGLFRGPHSISLRETSIERNLALITGHNGAGKTTLFTAFSLALHGNLSLGDRVNRETYHAFIRSKFHRFNGSDGLFEQLEQRHQVDEAAVSLAFEYVRSGKPVRVNVRRSWQQRENELKETLEVTVDDRLPDVDAEDYQTFLNDLIPPGMSFLCFFDAERLDAISHPNNATLLAEAIRRLLGLDVVRRLRADLERYGTAQKSEGKHSRPLFDALFEVDAATEKDQAALTQLSSRRESLAQQQQILHSQVAELERQLDAEGSGYAKRREKLRKKLEKADQRINELEAHLSAMATGLLPFTLAPALSRSLDQRLEREAHAATHAAFAQTWLERRGQIETQLAAGDFWKDIKLPKAQQQTLRERLLEALAFEQDNTDASGAVIHPLAEPDRLRLRGWLDQVHTSLPNEVDTIAKELAGHVQDRRRARNDLARVPQEEVLKPLHETLLQLQEQLGANEAENEALVAEEQALKFKLEQSEKQRFKVLADLERTRAAERRLELASKGQLVLRTYEDALTRQRLETLEQALLRRFNALCRKDQLLDRAMIDPRTFQIELRAADGLPLLLDSFSAGERQLFGLSLLWALRDVTGHQLPLVIDTPLGRLDQLHRERMMQEFIPAVSDQVLLLTTDAELDEALTQSVQQHVAVAYHVTFEPALGESQLSLASDTLTTLPPTPPMRTSL